MLTFLSSAKGAFRRRLSPSACPCSRTYLNEFLREAGCGWVRAWGSHCCRISICIACRVLGLSVRAKHTKIWRYLVFGTQPFSAGLLASYIFDYLLFNLYHNSQATLLCLTCKYSASCPPSFLFRIRATEESDSAVGAALTHLKGINMPPPTPTTCRVALLA